MYNFKNEEYWVITSFNSQHSHPLSNNILFHPTLRKMDFEFEEYVYQLYKSGTTPRSILNILKFQFSNKLFIPKDIYNIVYQKKQKQLNGQLPLAALLSKLNSGPFYSYVYLDSNSNISRLFFAHKTSIKLAKVYSNVVMLDCTYSTNSSKIPLLNIIGINSAYQNFSIGFAFISQETEQDYSWVLLALKQHINNPLVFVIDREQALINSINYIFPMSKIQICQWHIECGLRKNISGYFKQIDLAQNIFNWDKFLKDWYNMLKSSNINELFTNYSIFINQYSKVNKKIESYIGSTWCIHFDKFASPFTNYNPNLGVTTTSRIEGNHAIIKQFLGSSNLNLLSVFERINIMLSFQFQSIEYTNYYQRTKQLNFFKYDQLKGLISKVSYYALSLLYHQLNIIEPVNECRCTILFIYKLPCYHKLNLLNGAPIPIEYIDSQWLLKNEADIFNNSIDLETSLGIKTIELINGEAKISNFNIGSLINNSLPNTLNFKKSKNKGRPKAAKAKSGRILSSGEEIKKKDKLRICSNCKKPGHNTRTCKYLIVNLD